MKMNVMVIQHVLIQLVDTGEIMVIRVASLQAGAMIVQLVKKNVMLPPTAHYKT